jgi:hypothetical protein
MINATVLVARYLDVQRAAVRHKADDVTKQRRIPAADIQICYLLSHRRTITFSNMSGNAGNKKVTIDDSFLSNKHFNS